MVTIKMIKGDITKIDADAIVNAANKTLLGGGGVDGAIHKAAGRGLLAECIKLHGCKVGEAKITRAYELPCKYIIHTVGPVWHGGNKGEDRLLANCYSNSLKLASLNGIKSIAFPSISTGVYHFPVDRAAKIAVKTVTEYIDNSPAAFNVIEWVLFDDSTFQTYKQALETINKEELF